MRPCSFCNNGFTPIHEAARRASFATMQVFTNWGEGQGCGGERMMLSPDIEGNLPLHLAVHSGDVKVGARLWSRYSGKPAALLDIHAFPGDIEVRQKKNTCRRALEKFRAKAARTHCTYTVLPSPHPAH